MSPEHDDPSTAPGMPWMHVELADIEEERDTDVIKLPAWDAWQAWLDSMEH